jgi:uncharacterized metal-binding protein YceD (DUF177 family)
MNTRPDERLSYIELARQGARVERRLAAQDLSRLSSIARIQGSVDVALEFYTDELGRFWVKGSADARTQTRCQRCLGSFERALHAQVSFCIAQEPLASGLAKELDVFTAGSDTVSLSDLVEDDLLMALPERLCEREPCEYAPQLYYPASEPPAEDGGSATENPFSVLAALKNQADS